MSIEEILRLLRGHRSNGSSDPTGFTVPPLEPDERQSAMRAVQEALAPKQSDESHLVVLPFSEDGDILVHKEEWIHENAGLKVVTRDVRVLTCTGELVEAKAIRVVCLVCGGADSVVTHCRCGTACCRRCLRHDPVDGSPLCPACHHQALETFNAWAAHDRHQSGKEPRHE